MYKYHLKIFIFCIDSSGYVTNGRVGCLKFNFVVKPVFQISIQLTMLALPVDNYMYIL